MSGTVAWAMDAKRNVKRQIFGIFLLCRDSTHLNIGHLGMSVDGESLSLGLIRGRRYS